MDACPNWVEKSVEMMNEDSIGRGSVLRRYLAAGALGLGLLLATLADALAQEAWTLTIQDGIVEVNDRTIENTELPESLDVSGMSVRVTFAGVASPVVELKGRFYAVGPEGLVELDRAEVHSGSHSVFFLGGQFVIDPGGEVVVRSSDTDGFGDDVVWFDVGYANPAMREFVQTLQTRAEEMQEFSDEIALENVAEPKKLADQMRVYAQMTKEMASELPRLDMASYWDDVRESDSELYDSLVREWQTETQINDLAIRIRMTPQGEGRVGLERRLRQLLDEAFELKQQNRRREIAQLEADLEELERRTQEREAARGEIIERRFRELVEIE
jgi:hypothetical protein